MKNRLDIILVEKKLSPSREKAKEIIKSGQVSVNGKICSKPSEQFEDDSEIIILGETLKYVGRGGLKLEKAIELFSLDLAEKTCADIGASTGGFTDCMLQRGAKKVYAVDVGHDQLVQKLRDDSRVINLEGINVRYISKETIPEKLDFISVDVSFISLRLVLLVLFDFLSDNGKMVALIKPQFEVGRENVGKNGIVKSQKLHITMLNGLVDFISDSHAVIKNVVASPIKGSDGNVEYLALIEKTDYNKSISIDIKKLVKEAFQ